MHAEPIVFCNPTRKPKKNLFLNASLMVLQGEWKSATRKKKRDQNNDCSRDPVPFKASERDPEKGTPKSLADSRQSPTAAQL